MLSDSSLFVLRDISLRRCVPAVGKPYIFKCYGHHRDNDWGPSHQDRHFVRSPRILSIELWVPPGSGGVVSESASMQAGITSTATLPPPPTNANCLAVTHLWPQMIVAPSALNLASRNRCIWFFGGVVRRSYEASAILRICFHWLHSQKRSPCPANYFSSACAWLVPRAKHRHLSCRAASHTT